MLKGGAVLSTNSKNKLSVFLFEKLDKSIIVNFLIKLRLKFLSLRIRVIGAFFASLGAYAIIKGLIDFFFDNSDFTVAFYAGLVVFFVSLPMLYYNSSVLSFIRHSLVGGYIIKISDARSEHIEINKTRGITAIGFLLGAVMGYFDIIVSLKIVGTLFLAALIMSYPILGYFVSMLLISFAFGSKATVVVMILTLASVIVKLLRMKLMFSKISRKLGALLLPLALYELIILIINGTGLAYLVATLLCFFAPSVFNKSGKVKNGIKFVIYPTVLVSLVRFVAYALNYLAVRFNIHTFGINFDAFSHTSNEEVFLYLISFVVLVCMAVSHNKPFNRFFAGAAALTLAVSVYFTYSFEISVHRSFIFGLLSDFEIVPLVLVPAFCVFTVTYSLAKYNSLAGNKDISLRTRSIFEKYDFHHYVLSTALVIAAAFCGAVLLPYSGNMLIVCFFVLGLFTSLASLFVSEADKAISSTYDKQNGLNASLDI